MSPTPRALEVARCPACRTSLLPRVGPCPRCGAAQLVPHQLPPRAIVLAATELLHPPAGWSSPHRLALVELAEGVRVLARVEGPVPRPGDEVVVEPVEGRFQIRTG